MVMVMKAFKITLVAILSLLDIYLLYSAIGYLIIGIKTPIIIGNGNTVFMGMYIMAITFSVLFALLTTIIIIMSMKFFKKKK